MPSDSDDDLSEMTVYDLDLETDAAVIDLDRYSDISGPGSPSAAASLDRAAAMASATLSSSVIPPTKLVWHLRLNYQVFDTSTCPM